MIKPHKYLDLKNCVISVSALMLKIMQENRIIKYDELFDYVIKANGDNVKYIFVPALDFLFLLGKIEYYQESDSLELIL